MKKKRAPVKSCAFTGHRPKSFPWKYDETARDCLLLKEVLAAQIRTLADTGATDYLSGMAQGVDLWSSKIVLDIRKENPMLKRNRYLVDHSSILLAVYNRSWRSGTGATVRYVKKCGRDIFMIDSTSQNITYFGNGTNS